MKLRDITQSLRLRDNGQHTIRKLEQLGDIWNTGPLLKMHKISGSTVDDNGANEPNEPARFVDD